jgi:hypothetical protein
MMMLTWPAVSHHGEELLPVDLQGGGSQVAAVQGGGGATGEARIQTRFQPQINMRWWTTLSSDSLWSAQNLRAPELDQATQSKATQSISNDAARATERV